MWENLEYKNRDATNFMSQDSSVKKLTRLYTWLRDNRDYASDGAKFPATASASSDRTYTHTCECLGSCSKANRPGRYARRSLSPSADMLVLRRMTTARMYMVGTVPMYHLRISGFLKRIATTLRLSFRLLACVHPYVRSSVRIQCLENCNLSCHGMR